jgi:hypothetical protein
LWGRVRRGCCWPGCCTIEGVTSERPTLRFTTKDGEAKELACEIVAGRDGSSGLARREKRNALNDAAVQGIEAFFRSLPDGVKVGVLDAEVPNFSAVGRRPGLACAQAASSAAILSFMPDPARAVRPRASGGR